MYGAHRVAWVIYKGSIPEDLWVLHTCDNRRCVNPEHLYLGTRADNELDMVSRGRSPKGKLTEVQALEILKRFFINEDRICDITKDYQVRDRTIEHIVHGRTWKHVFKQFMKGGELIGRTN
jgi:hypothetical protein